MYFNPRSPHGERRHHHLRLGVYRRFQSTLPARGATDMGGEEVCKRGQFQSTLPARGATARSRQKEGKKIFQSTLPAWGATIRGNFQKLARLISIHAPRTGSDERIYQHLTFTHGFQSTLPARGATSSTFADLLGSAHFNPRSPHGERRAGESRLRRADSISIHAPRTGSDRSGAGRTAVHLPISIHAPRTGSDATLSRRFLLSEISIHAPRTGSDGNPAVQCQ